jgi:hypothetical protein
MKIELRKLRIATGLSQETTAYSAEIWINGERAFLASNHGTGGCDLYHPVGRYTVQEVDHWLVANRSPTTYDGIELPADLETEVATLMDRIAAGKRLKRLLRTSVVAIRDDDVVSWPLKGRDPTRLKAALLVRYPALAILESPDTETFDRAVTLILADR